MRYEDELADMKHRKDQAYRERNNMVAMLARVYPSGIRKTDIPGWDAAWHGCVYIDFPWGQASWHYHESQAYMFTGLPPYTAPYDGHHTEQKYDMMQAWCMEQDARRKLKPVSTGGIAVLFAMAMLAVALGVLGSHFGR